MSYRPDSVPTVDSRSGSGVPQTAIPQSLVAPTVVELRRPASHRGSQLPWRLDEFNKFLLSAAPMPRITTGVGREACATLGFSRAVFLSTDFKSSRAKVIAGYGFDARSLVRIDEPFESGPWIEACVRKGWPAYTPDAMRDRAVPAKYVRRFNLGPLLCTPVCDSKGPVGVMLIDCGGKPFTVSDELIEVSRAVGLSIGLALEAAAASRSHPEDAPDRRLHLTPRERQMLRMLSRGLANKEIATATGLSVYTVRDYVSSLLRCLDVTCRSGAVARAWELGLLGDAQQCDSEEGEAQSEKPPSLVS